MPDTTGTARRGRRRSWLATTATVAAAVASLSGVLYVEQLIPEHARRYMHIAAYMAVIGPAAKLAGAMVTDWLDDRADKP